MIARTLLLTIFLPIALWLEVFLIPSYVGISAPHISALLLIIGARLLPPPIMIPLAVLFGAVVGSIGVIPAPYRVVGAVGAVLLVSWLARRWVSQRSLLSVAVLCGAGLLALWLPEIILRLFTTLDPDRSVPDVLWPFARSLVLHVVAAGLVSLPVLLRLRSRDSEVRRTASW